MKKIDFRELLASDEFQQDLLHQPFNSFDEFANFVIQELNQYLSWFFKAPEGTNFFPQEGNFLREQIPVILGKYLPSEAVGKGKRGFVSTEGIGDGKGEEMVLSPQPSPTPQTRPIFFPPFAFFEEQEKANHSRGEDLGEEDEAPAKRVMVEVAALDTRSQPLPPLLPLNLSQPALSPLNLSQPPLNLSQPGSCPLQTFEETRMRRSSAAPESGSCSSSRRSGASRERHLTG